MERDRSLVSTLAPWNTGHRRGAVARARRQHTRSSYGLSSSGARRNLGWCQVGSETERPCLRPAVVEIWGVPFCEQCVREQEIYFAIGELTQKQTDNGTKQDRGLHSELLVTALNWVRRSSASPTDKVEKRPQTVKR